MPGFSCQDLCPDGVFLTPVSGLHYVLFLFDQAEVILDAPHLSGEAQFAQVREQVRHHEDRVSFLESRHNTLLDRTNRKAAIDAEFDDFIQNRNDSDWFVVQGLPRLAQDRNDWQEAVKRQVVDLIKMTLAANKVRLEFTVLYVVNPFKFQTGLTTYNVRMNSAAVSERIRDLYSGFFRKNRPVHLPPAFKNVSLRNKVTKETKIRISILKQLGAIFKDSNRGGSFHVRGYDPRPRLTTFPAQGSSGRPQSFSFIQAVTTLPATFNDEQLAMIFREVGNACQGSLRTLFIVLNDDDRERCLELAKQSRTRRPAATGSGSGSGSGSGANLVALSSSGTVFGPGTGMEVESGFLESLHRPPPPPPPAGWAPTPAEAKDHRGRKRSPAPSDTDPETVKTKFRRQSRSPGPSDTNLENVKTKSRRQSRSPGPSDTELENVKTKSRRRSRSPESSPESTRSKPKKRKKSKRSKRTRRQSTSSSSSSSASSSSGASRSHHKKSKKTKITVNYR